MSNVSAIRVCAAVIAKCDSVLRIQNEVLNITHRGQRPSMPCHPSAMPGIPSHIYPASSSRVHIIKERCLRSVFRLLFGELSVDCALYLASLLHKLAIDGD